MNDNRNNYQVILLAIIACLIFLGILVGASNCNSAHAEENGSLEFTTSPSNDSAQEVFSTNDGTADNTVVINNVQETTVDANNAPATLKANAIGYTPIADMLSTNTYANILYDVFLNQGNTFDDFIIFQAGDYRYFLIYGNLEDDLSFDDASVVQLDYTNQWQSGKRYTLTYSEDVTGTFRPNGYVFLSNIKSQNAQSPNVTFERKEQFKMRIALYILAVVTLFSTFRFFRKSTVGGF